jgi:hypothetical protein
MIMLVSKEHFTDEPATLAKFGFNPKEKVPPLNVFSQQMESYALHIIEDRPISNLYSYFVDNGQIYIDKSKETKLFVDPQERNGLAYSGVQEAVKKALADQGKIVFLYSPPGPVALESGTRYDQVKPYRDGQLYVLVGKEKDQQVDSIAIGVSKDQEQKTLPVFLGDKYIRPGFDDEIGKIKYYLTHPIPTNWNIDDLIGHLDKFSHIENFSVYKNVHDQEFFLSDVISDLRQGWLGGIKPKLKMEYENLYRIAQKTGDTKNAFVTQLQNYFPIYSKDGKMRLGGGCGGDGVSKDELDPLAGIRVNPLSTNYRLTTPSIQEIMKGKDKDSDEYGSLKFHCPACNGEHMRPRHELLKACPINGKEIAKC